MILNTLKLQIDTWLNDYFEAFENSTYDKIIYEAMNYSLSIGGKRIRPILLILSYTLYNKDYKKVMPIASALEMIHTYSLIHDDLPCMDDDDLRRGKPTSHIVYGEAIAVLAGDALLNEAMYILLRQCLEDNSKENINACLLISKSSGADGMIGGQVVDIISEGKNIDIEVLRYLHRKKTGALIKASILAGAILAKANISDLEILEEFGDKLGLAFQIKDDILDIEGETDKIGKPINSDINNNKTTYVTVYGLDKCKIMCEDLTIECLSLLDKLDKDTSELRAITNVLLNRQF